MTPAVCQQMRLVNIIKAVSVVLWTVVYNFKGQHQDAACDGTIT